MKLSARITRLESAAPPDAGSFMWKVEQETLRQLSDAELKALESAHRAGGRELTAAEVSAIERWQAILDSEVRQLSTEDLERMISASEHEAKTRGTV